MAKFTPEEILAKYRAFDPASGNTERGDWLANAFFDAYGDTEYGAKGYQPTGMLSPQEQMQIEWLRADKGLNSGNNKDDRIKRIRQMNNMANERLDGDNRYIIRNKINKEGKADGLSSGDVFQIGDYTQSDTGKDDGMFQSVINKGLPGFDVGDVTSLPGIDWAAMVAAPFTGGMAPVVLEGLKAVEAGELSPELLTSIVAQQGGWGSLLEEVGMGGGEGFGIFDKIKEMIPDFELPQIPGFGDLPTGISDIFGDMDLEIGDIADFLPEFGLPGAPARGQPSPMQLQQQRDPLELLPLFYESTWDKY